MSIVMFTILSAVQKISGLQQTMILCQITAQTIEDRKTDKESYRRHIMKQQNI